jgi:hypothetical protein
MMAMISDLVNGTETMLIMWASVRTPTFCFADVLFLIDMNPGGFPGVREGELQQADCRHRGPAQQGSPECFEVLPSQDLQEGQVKTQIVKKLLRRRLHQISRLD